MRKFAVIDVGSNSVRLMFVVDGKVLYKSLSTTRLGEGLAQSATLKLEAIERSAQAVAKFYERAKDEGAENVYAFATAAVRSATNKNIFLDRVKALCALHIEVISGEEEAELGVLGALGLRDGAVIDVGGASTEIVVKKQGAFVYKKSVDVGVVRLKDYCGSDLGILRNYCEEAMKEYGEIPFTGKICAIGGTATTLAAQYLRLTEYDSNKVTGTSISLETLQTLTARFLAMTAEEMSALPCMPKGRADVLAHGAVWLCMLMERFGFTHLVVSDCDNLEGYAIKRGLMELTK